LFTKNPTLLSVTYFLSIALGTLLINTYIQSHKTLDLFKEAVSNTLYNNANILFAKNQSIINILNVITANFDKIIIFQLLGAQQTAGYVIAITLPNRLRALIKQFEPYFFAKFSGHTPTAIGAKLLPKFLMALLCSAPFFIVYVICSSYFFYYFLPQYMSMVLLSNLYALSIFSGAAVVPYAVLKAHARENQLYIHTVVSSLIQILFLYIGVQSAGLQGAIVGKMLSTLVVTILTYGMALRCSLK
jgi:O-antigen/teichoic acid export membrane protein